MDKILTADFSSGKDRVTVRGLWQFDRGVKLKVIGINVADVNRVDFAPVIASEAVPVVVTPDEDGTFTVSIPGAATKSPYDVTAYIYVDTAEYGYTVKAVNMPVILRPEAGKPGEEKPDPFGEAVEKVSGYAKEARDSARAASESASKSEKIAEQVAVLEKQVELSVKKANASEQAAGISEKNAAESASQARESATIARSAADQAAKSATAAAESETTAAQQAQNAAQSATNAARSAESAAQSAETAKTAADAAEKSASSAQQASRSAAESASTATAAAQTATTAAGNAAESVTLANQSAETAGQKATAAETSANNAAESATEAGKSATAAGDSASVAKTSETAAAASAVTATEQAEKIKASAEQIEKNKTDVTSLKEDLSDWSRLEGYELANLKSKLKLEKENMYASSAGIGKPPYYGAFDGCNVYSLDIEPDVYTFTEARFALPIDESGSVLAEHIDNATSFDNTKLSASKIYLSIADAKESIKSFSISKGTQLRQFDKFPEHTGIPKLENDVKKLENDVIDVNMPLNMHSVKKIGIFEKNGDNILLSDARTNLRKGIRLIFEANIVNGADFEIGFSVSESSADTLPHNRFVVNSTTIEYYESIGQTEYSNSFTHNLLISKNVQVIFEYLTNGTVDICLLSNGEVFKKNIVFTMNSVAVPYVKSNGLVAKDCKFTFICTDIRKKIWCFGDSYFAYSTARWTYYLREHGYDNNVLLDGFPGMGSTNARKSFSKLLKLGKPKIAVWFEGMNDGADTTDSEPNDDWKSDKDIFIALCEEKSVEPIFATIPNVPNINHKGKNKWIKESGYRYIDMCHAVGADLDVNWYDGMLSNDKIHPSENGARALFAQVLLDLPEVMINNL